MAIGGTPSELGLDFNPLDELLDRLGRVESQSDDTSAAISRMQREVRTNTTQTNSIVQTLENGFTRLIEKVDGYVASMTRLTNTNRQGRRATEELAATMDDAYEVYRKMGVDVRKLEVNLEDLKFTESELSKVVKLGADYEIQGNAQRATSYDALSQKYRAMKVLYDNMTESERASNQQFVADLRATYEQMNLIQQASGKYQLQVGNYSKAMTGLNISTQQVIRELPTLANSAATFAIAISNNIPILVDNIQAVRNANKAQLALRETLLKEAEAAEVTGDAVTAMAKKQEAANIKATSVIKGLVSSIFSWQTAIVLVLTVIPGLIRNIQKKRKEQEELNKTTKEAADFTKIYGDAMVDINKDVVKSSSDLRTLYYVSQDAKRSMEDRITAAQNLKKEYEDAFANYSAEEIALGKAISAYNELTKALERNAEMRAYMNKITELKEQEIEVQAEKDKASAVLATARATEAVKQTEYELKKQEQESFPVGSAPYEARKELVESYKKALDDAKDATAEAHAAWMIPDAQLQSIGNAISKLRDAMPVSLFDTDKVDKQGKKFVDKVKDYFYEAVRAFGDILGEGTIGQKLLDLDWAFVEQQDKRKKELENLEKSLADAETINKDATEKQRAEAKRRAAIYKEQITNLRTLMENEVKAYTEARERLWEEYKASYQVSVEEEPDYDAEIRNQAKARLQSEKKVNDSIAYQLYESKKITAEQLNERLKQNETEFWKDYLQTLRDNGTLTVAAYNEIMSHLIKAEEKNTAKLRRQRGRSGRNLISILMAQTKEYGEVPQDAKDRGNERFRVLKAEYIDFANAVDDAFKKGMKSMEEWIDLRLKVAEAAVEAAEKESAAAKEALDLEQQARVNGYANNVELARKEYEEKLRIQRKAEEEQRQIARAQMAINTATQISELLTATAKIWSAEGIKGLLGVPLAIAATTAMWGAFAAAKVQAAKLTTYGEGMSEYLDYGGSHASGHDIDFGTAKDGSRRRVERGEMIGVINKKNVQKYGVDTITNIIASLNHGNFEEKYGLAFAGLALSNGNAGVDLSKVESGINTLVRQGEVRIVQTEQGRIEYRGHNKRIIKN